MRGGENDVVLSRKAPPVLLFLLAMALILVVATVVVAYVAYPHRGEELPVAPWLGEAMKRGVDSLPVLDDEFTRQ